MVPVCFSKEDTIVCSITSLLVIKGCGGLLGLFRTLRACLYFRHTILYILLIRPRTGIDS